MMPSQSSNLTVQLGFRPSVVSSLSVSSVFSSFGAWARDKASRFEACVAQGLRCHNPDTPLGTFLAIQRHSGKVQTRVTPCVRQVKTLEDYNKYCHYVAGLVGIGLSELFGEH